MAILSWGKCKIETCPSADGAPNNSWTELDTPKDGTTHMTTEQGEVTEAKEEGGEVVDVRIGKSKATFEFTLFKKKGKALPFTDTDGYIAGEHAFRLTPETTGAPGFIIDRASVSVVHEYSTQDGWLAKYTVKALKPKTGATVKDHTGG